MEENVFLRTVIFSTANLHKVPFCYENNNILRFDFKATYLVFTGDSHLDYTNSALLIISINEVTTEENKVCLVTASCPF